MGDRLRVVDRLSMALGPAWGERGCVTAHDWLLLIGREARDDLLGRDRTLQPGVAQERDRPAREHGEPVLEPGQEGEVDEQPEEPADDPRDPDGSDLRHGSEPGDGGEAPVVVVVERPRPMSPRSPAMVAAAWRPDCIATSAIPGRPSRDIRSPITKTSGNPGREQSALTSTRPARSVRAPLALASRGPSGVASIPAAQTTSGLRSGRGCRLGRCVDPHLSLPVTVVPTRT